MLPRLLVRTGIPRRGATALARHSLAPNVSTFLTAGALSGSSDLGVIGPNVDRMKFRLMSASADLSDILTREIAEEDANETDTMPSDLSELKSKIEVSWNLVDNSLTTGGSGATIRLVKKDPISSTGAKVGVTFHCQDTIADDVDVEDGYEDENEDEEDAVSVRFTVTVARAGKIMVLTCLSEDASVVVERAAMVDGDDVEAVISDGVDEKWYQGPEFEELAEDLQQVLGTYVEEECGVDGDVAAFITMFADYKEQCEYVGWLKGVQSMI